MKAKHDNKRFYRLIVLFFLAFLFSGCTSPPKETQDTFFEKWREIAEKSRGYSPSSQRQSVDIPGKKAETMTTIAPKIEEKKPLPTQKTTLEMHDIDVAVLLRAMAKAVDQNIVISENVTGKININVKEAPWHQIFQSVLQTHGLTYGWEGDILHVLASEDKEKQLKQLEAEQKIKSKQKEIDMVEPLVTQIIKIDYSNAAKLKDNLMKFLSEKAENQALGTVMVDEHTNSLIVQAIRSDIEKMIPLIRALDRPTSQVLIESQIVEATQNTARELGVRWGGLYYDGANDLWLAPSTGAIEGATSETVSPTAGFAANFPASLADGTGLTLGMIAADVGGALLALELQALQSEGKLNILSSPSITTLDHQVARIESGNEVPYQTVENGEVNIQYKKVVLSLEVIPRVIDQSTLKLEIKTNKDELDWANTVGGNPSIISKKAETTVIVYDGQTTVIGGLSKEKTDKSTSGVPLLQDIPLLGRLFQGKKDSSNMEEILIFITPHILKERKTEPVAVIDGSPATHSGERFDNEKPQEAPAATP